MKGQGQMCMLHIYISYLAGNYNQQKAHCLIEVIANVKTPWLICSSKIDFGWTAFGGEATT